MRRAGLGLAVVLGLALQPRDAAATWSIVAVDPSTREVGVAVASCVEAPYGTTLLPFVAGLAPGHGALAAQAVFDHALRDHGVALLQRGAAPRSLLAALMGPDPDPALRQYGIVTLDRTTAAFTGGATQPWAGHLEHPGVTVQGNILRGPAVIEDALIAFEAAAPSCPWTLADRLMLALEAGAARGGDGRCSAAQAALAAALRVAAPGDDPEAPTIDLRIPSQRPGGAAAVALLRVAYDQWRREHPPDASGCEPGPTTSDEAATRGCGCRSTAEPRWAPLFVLLAIRLTRFTRRAVRPVAPRASAP